MARNIVYATHKEWARSKLARGGKSERKEATALFHKNLIGGGGEEGGERNLRKCVWTISLPKLNHKQEFLGVDSMN